MMGSRTQFGMVAREFGNTPNGSLPAYAPMGEMAQYHNPRAHLKYKKTTALGEKQGLGAILPMDALGGAGLIALGMIYVGLNFPYSKETFEFVKKRIDQPKETTQALLLGAGTLILVNRANR
jgi:hypothetical protein|tara:strand:- start:1374 stop:1739 length:366 start_codon:yes stop_codon:yes gene_type:complete